MKLKNQIQKKLHKVYFYGFDTESDKKLFQKSTLSYEDKKIILDDLTNNQKFVKIVIGITRYNFFCMDKIINKILSYENKITNVKAFNIFPVLSIKDRFIRYLEGLNLPEFFEFDIVDEKLIELLEKFQILRTKKIESENDTARLLGILCEQMFIGPWHIVIDTCHTCNTNCTHCRLHSPTNNQTKDYYKMKMSFENFKKIIDDAAELKVEMINLIGGGEPLLNPDLIKMIEYIKSKGLKALFFTNGILLTEKISKKIIELGLDEVWCSLPAGSGKTFKTINPMNNEKTYDKIISNLSNLTELKKRKNLDNPKIVMTHVIHTQNHHELIEMAQKDIEVGANEARYFLFRMDPTNVHLKLTKEDFSRIKKQVPIVEKIFKNSSVHFKENIKFQIDNFEVNKGYFSKDFFLKHGCIIGYLYSDIEANGNVRFCCHNRNVGNISKSSYKELWTSKKYEKYRVQAKYIDKNKDVLFENNQTLFDDECFKCEKHPMMNAIFLKLKKNDLMKYYKN